MSMDNLFNRVSRSGRRDGGFTLIELLVVIAVLVILAGIVIFNVTGVTGRGKTSACQTDVKTVQTAVDSAISDNGGTLPAWLTSSAGGTAMGTDLTNLVSNGYLHSVPGTCGTFTLTTTTPTQGGAAISVYTVTGA